MSASYYGGQLTRIGFLRSLVGTVQNECIDWPYSRNADGYGSVKLDGLQMTASRAMLIVSDGVGRADRQAAHRCGRPECVNPNHLYWATPKENQFDRRAHGTHIAGAACRNSRFTSEQIISIRYSDRGTDEALAARHGVAQPVISKILNCVTYQSAEAEVGWSRDEIRRQRAALRRRRGKRSTLSSDEVLRRRAVVEAAPSKGAAAKALGIHPDTLSHFLRHYAPDLLCTRGGKRKVSEVST